MMNLMMRLMNRILPSCAEVSRLSSRAMDEKLALRKRIPLRLHLLVCVWCRRNAHQLQLLRRLSRSPAPPAGDTERLSPEARERIAGALAGEERHPPDA